MNFNDMNDFYTNNSNDFYHRKVWQNEREDLAKFNATLLRLAEANSLAVDDLFHKSANNLKPILNRSYEFIAIPYEMDDEIPENGVVDNLIIQFTKQYLKQPIYIASTDSTECCVVKSNKLTTEIIWTLSSTHLNTPFIVFDIEKSVFILIDYDFPLQIIGAKPNILSDTEIIEWKSIFKREWLNVKHKYRSYTNLDSIMENDYPFILKILSE